MIPSVYAASSPWTQTDWSGGSGQTSWSDNTKFSSSSSIDTTSTLGQTTLSTNTEKLSNTGFESNLTSWNTGIQPDGLSGLQVWLKADAITGLNDGDSVTSWTDSSGNSNTASQSTAANKPAYKTSIVNSQPVVRFDGSNDVLVGTTISGINTSSISLFVIATGNSISANQERSPFSINNYNNGLRFERSSWGSGALGVYNNAASVSTATGTLAVGGYSASILEMVKQYSTQSDLWINGGSNANSTNATVTGTFTNTSYQIGDSVGGDDLKYSGDIAEVILYNAALSTSNRQAIEAYLQGKYAISAGYATLTRDTSTTYSSSVGSAKLVTGSNATSFTQSVNVGDTSNYFLTAYAYTNGSAVSSSDVELYYNGSTISTTYTSIGSGWYKLIGTLTGANASRQYGVQVKANKTVYIDNFSLNNYFPSGTLTSSIFDTEFSAGAAWGTLTYSSSGSTIAVKVRTSNSSSMTGATDFSSCSAATSGNDISSNSCVTDSHRYIQYQLSLSTSDTSSTPTLSDISTTFAVYDADAPSISLTALTPDPNSDNTPTLSGTATDSIGTVSNVQFQMDSTSGSWTACTATDGSFNSANETFSCTASTLTDGSHTMYVRATDSNSNTTSNVNASTDTFTIDATAPVSIELDNPGDNSYTNSERPSFKWKATSDATAGLSKYVLEIDNPSAGSGQVSGDFTIDSIPTSRTTDYETNKYTIHYEDFFDSDSTNNYISVYTKSHSDWDSSENDGKLREGRVSWKVKARDSVGNETLSSRTLFVDRSGPNVEFTQVNDSPFSSTSFSTTDKTPTIFGKITDSLSGGDSSKTQDENGPKVASGPKQVEVKIEKKEGLGYKLHTIYTINMDKPWYTCDGKEVTDNSKQKCDKYLPFKYTPEQSLELGTYKITISGKDKADNSSSETSFTLNITTLAHITTPEEKKIIEKETKPLKPEEKEKVQKELEITKPTEEVPISALEKALRQAQDKAGEQISQTSKSVLTATGNFIVSIFNGIGQGVRFTVDTTGKALAFVGDKAGQALVFVGKTTSNSLAALYNGTQSILALGEQAAQGGAITAGQGLTFVGQGIQEGVQAGVNTTGQILAFAGSKVGEGISSAVKTTGTLLATTGQGVNNTGKAIGRGYNQLANNAPGVTKTILTAVGSGVSTRGKAIANATNTASNAAAAVASTTVKIAQSTTSAIGSAANSIATTTSSIANNTTGTIGIVAHNAGNVIANVSNSIASTTSTVAQNTSRTAGNIANSLAKTTGDIAQKTGSTVSNAAGVIANATQKTVNSTKEGIGNLAFKVGEKTQGISETAGFALVKLGYLFVNEPTKIADVQVAVLSPTSVKVSWKTNHPANGKVNYGLDRTYPFDVQSEKRVTNHEYALTNLNPDTLYYFEVMSHNKNYVYDSNREFKTPAVAGAQKEK